MSSITVLTKMLKVKVTLYEYEGANSSVKMDLVSFGQKCIDE